MSTVKIENKRLEFGVRRGEYVDITDFPDKPAPVSDNTIKCLNDFDLWYRTLCAILYNFASSGHPGGSISSGHMVAAALIETMDYNIGDPDQPDADLISYAAGHKALGLYAMWASRNEMVRISRPELLPEDSGQAHAKEKPCFQAIHHRNGTFLSADRRRNPIVRSCGVGTAARHAEGPHRLRKDPFCGAHGLQAQTPVDNRLLP